GEALGLLPGGIPFLFNVLRFVALGDFGHGKTGKGSCKHARPGWQVGKTSPAGAALAQSGIGTRTAIGRCCTPPPPTPHATPSPRMNGRLHKHARERLAFAPGTPAPKRLAACKTFLRLENAMIRMQHDAGADGRAVARSL